MTYREAKAIALAHSRKVNACLEYEEGYRFFEKDALADGGDCDFVVLKTTGKCLPIAVFILNYKPKGRGQQRVF